MSRRRTIFQLSTIPRSRRSSPKNSMPWSIGLRTDCKNWQASSTRVLWAEDSTPMHIRFCDTRRGDASDQRN
jgi:hypothetical protein